MKDKTPDCEHCKYGDFVPERHFSGGSMSAIEAAFVVCRRYPESLRKNQNDWCGEFAQQEDAASE